MKKKQEALKQWELENNSEVELPDGVKATFLKMDGMYAHWDLQGELAIGNYDSFVKTKTGYKVI
jgi:hypothetical protein